MVILRHGDLLAPGCYRRHSRFARVANYVCDDRVLSLVTADVGAGPCQLQLARRTLGDVELVTVTEDGFVVLDGERHALRAAERYHSGIALPARRARGPLAATLPAAARFVAERGHEKSWAFLLAPTTARSGGSACERGAPPGGGSRFERALRARIEERVAALYDAPGFEGLSGVRGLGVGLTPSGDDFLCGYLHARHLLARLEIATFEHETLPAELCRSGDVLTRSFLRCAVAGAVSEPVQALLYLLCARPAEAELCSALERVLRMGETSGADWATGLCVTLSRFTETAPRKRRPARRDAHRGEPDGVELRG